MSLRGHTTGRTGHLADRDLARPLVGAFRLFRIKVLADAIHPHFGTASTFRAATMVISTLYLPGTVSPNIQHQYASSQRRLRWSKRTQQCNQHPRP